MTRVANVDSKAPISLCADEGIVTAIQFLELLNDINNDNHFVSFEEFYNDAIKEAISMKEDYPRWKASSGFSFFNYPFLLDSHAKGDILKIENMITMRHELQDSFFRAMFIGVNSPYLHLEVRRDSVVRDAIAQLASKTSHDLKKQLRVTFVGEEGIDDGGIQKEFFQMVVKEIFNPTHGMFQIYQDSRLCWFTKEYITDPGVTEEYMLIGRLLGLAIYNSNTLEIPFPVALFKKLLHLPTTLNDVFELDPALGRGLKGLLEYENQDFQELYDWTFQIQYDGPYNNRNTHDLKPNGSQIQLTKENRAEFVKLYVDFIFNRSVATAFQSFSDGLYSVVDRESLVVFRPEEFQQLVVGCSELDFKALENNARYEGWEESSVVLKQFWEIVHAMSLEEQKRLLFFTTGSDRAPVGGLGNLSFVIARNGPDSDRLPTSHTCYNVLLLNEYSSKEKLEERLKKAIGFAHCGFFLL
ncbi:UNVERIFIED_CONTAM: putative E3 ubiquitin-protein ligase HTD2 [Siphonaria sp. JEL0065]|nr:putative E3 ubiquitin-protein ligase HTD2 [Siphonaria sp. JEL0065]